MATSEKYCPLQGRPSGREDIENENRPHCPSYCNGTVDSLVVRPLLFDKLGPEVVMVQSKCADVPDPKTQYKESAILFLRALQHLRNSG